MRVVIGKELEASKPKDDDKAKQKNDSIIQYPIQFNLIKMKPSMKEEKRLKPKGKDVN